MIFKMATIIQIILGQGIFEHPGGKSWGETTQPVALHLRFCFVLVVLVTPNLKVKKCSKNSIRFQKFMLYFLL